MRPLAAIVTLAAAACSSAKDAAPPPTTPDERRALEEARAMIPAGELPAEKPDPDGKEAPEQ